MFHSSASPRLILQQNLQRIILHAEELSMVISQGKSKGAAKMIREIPGEGGWNLFWGGMSPPKEVVHMIMQVMLARPDCRHMAEYVIGACEKRSTFLPRAMECLRCHGDWGLPLLFGELQAEEHSATKAAALAAAAEAAATQLASSQAEVQKLKEERAAQAEALKAAAAQELAAAKAVINSLMAEAALSSQALAALEAATARLKQERDDVLKHAQKRFEEQASAVSQLKAGASSASAQVLAAEQRGAQLERELAHVKAEQAKERSAAKREVCAQVRGCSMSKQSKPRSAL
eukprot:1146366-Pelagomonas_calceolata.AAC.4